MRCRCGRWLRRLGVIRLAFEGVAGGRRDYAQHLDDTVAEAEETLAELRSDERMADLEQRVTRLETALASTHARSVGIPDPAQL